jgi:translocation and assembly module TamB
VIGGLLVPPFLVVALVFWLLWSESGLHAGARMVSWATDGQVTLVAPSGHLGGELHLEALHIATPDVRVTIDELTLVWRALALLEGHADIERLSAARIVVAQRPADAAGAPTQPPMLALPLAVSVAELAVERFDLTPWDDSGVEAESGSLQLRALEGALASDGLTHTLAHFSVASSHGDLRLRAVLDSTQSPPGLDASGTFAGVRDGREFSADYQVRGDLQTLQVHLVAQGAGLAGEADARIEPFGKVPLRALRVALGEIDPSAFDARAPQAALTLNVDLAAISTEAQGLAGTFAIDNRVPRGVDQNGVPLLRASGQLQWTPETTNVEALEVELAGDGRLSGSLRWQPPAQTDAAAAIGLLTADLALAGIRLEQLDTRLPSTVVAGRIKADGDRYRQSASIALTAGVASITGSAEYQRDADDASPAMFNAEGTLAGFNPGAFIAESPAAALNLSFSGDGVLAEVPEIRLAWQFSPSTVEGRALGGRGRIALRGEHITEADVVVDLAGNRLTARGAWGRIEDALEVAIDAPSLSALGEEYSGQAWLKGVLSGTRQEPAGRVELSAQELRLPGEIGMAAVTGSGSLEAGLDGPAQLALAITGLDGPDKARWVDSASLVVTGKRSSHAVEVVATTPGQDAVNLRLEGALLRGSTAASGADGVGARWRGQLTALALTGRYPLTLLAPAGLMIARTRLVLDSARLDAGSRGRIELAETTWTPEQARVRGTVTGLILEPAVAQGNTRARRDPLTLGAQWDLRLDDTVDGELRVFRESGDLVVGAELVTRVGLDHLEARLNATDNRLALSWEVRGEELGMLTGAVTALAERGETGGWRLAPDAAILGSASFAMPSVAWLSRLSREETVLGGALEGEFSFSGTPAQPLATGRIRGSDLSVLLVEHGLYLSGGDLLAEFDRNQLRLTRLRFTSPNRVKPNDSRVPFEALVQTPGRLDVSGAIALDSGIGAFGFVADRLPVLQRVDRWMILSGEGSASSTWTSIELVAALRADAGYIELAQTPPPSLSSDVVMIGRQNGAATGGMRVSADVKVSLGEALYLSGFGLDTRLAGDLQLTLRDGHPLAGVGTIATVGGVYKGYGQNLTLERGLINFQGVVDNPGLNVIALRKGLPVEAGIAVVGSARRPEIRLVSEPNVPDPEKLSWIVLGRAPSAGSGGDLGVLLPAAQALLGGPGGGMTEQLSRSLGFDEVGIGQGDAGGAGRGATSRVVGGGDESGQGSVSNQVLTLGKRLSSDLLLSFEQGLGGAQSLVKLSYQLSRRVSVVVRGGTDNAADVYYTVSFR